MCREECLPRSNDYNKLKKKIHMRNCYTCNDTYTVRICFNMLLISVVTVALSVPVAFAFRHGVVAGLLCDALCAIFGHVKHLNKTKICIKQVIEEHNCVEIFFARQVSAVWIIIFSKLNVRITPDHMILHIAICITKLFQTVKKQRVKT